MLTEIVNGPYLQHALNCCELPAWMLEELAYSDDPEVRIAVTDNPATPLDVLWVLANDENPDVRYALAENHNVDNAVLIALTLDDNPYVVRRAERTLRRLANPQESVVRFALTASTETRSKKAS